MENLSSTFVVMGPDQSATQVPVTPTVYQELDRRFGSFKGHSLVAMHTFESDWPTWEIHPKGDEIVVLVSGKAEFVLEKQAGRIVLDKPGDFVIVPRGTWHTAKIAARTVLLFVTPGEGTENKAIE